MHAVPADERWIPNDDYHYIYSKVPIVCVDVLLKPVRQPSRLGLIRRETYGGELVWALIGGAILRDKPLYDAVLRHVDAALGQSIRVDPEIIALGTVVEYFTQLEIGSFQDPAKHAITLTYTASYGGTASPQGEALNYSTFTLIDLRSLAFGFGQREVIARLLSGNRQSS